jgi:hypothetical protein
VCASDRFDLLIGQRSATFITAVSDEVTFSAASTRKSERLVAATRDWTASTNAMMPNHSRSAFTSLLAHTSVLYASKRERMSRRAIITPAAQAA